MSEPKKVLILLANPYIKDGPHLRLGKEVSLIQEVLRGGNYQGDYEIAWEPAVTSRTLQRALVQHKPWIVHYSGHGAAEQGLVFEDEAGQVSLASTETIANLFKVFENQVECVVLNACFSRIQAEEIAKYINYVIGMDSKIGDNAAIEFSYGFYNALGGRLSVENSFSLGCNAIQQKGLKLPEHLTPQLIKRGVSRSTPRHPQLLTGSLSTDSSFYVERSPAESICYQTITQLGALIRIFSTGRKWGKTSLLSRVLNYAKTEFRYHTIRFSFDEAPDEAFTSLSNFFQWFCSTITDDLCLVDTVEEFWGSPLGDKQKCSNYFERYLLPQVKIPLVLGLDDAALLFKRLEDSECPKIAKEFFSMLRIWNNYGAEKDTEWQKLRLVLTLSLENKISLPYDESPLNVGVPIHLKEFDQLQVQNLIQSYKLNWSSAQLEQLMRIIGGHPYLLQIALFYISSGMTLEESIEFALAEKAPYDAYLCKEITKLSASLKKALKSVMISENPVFLESHQELCDMGLIKRQGDGFIPFCKLYQIYFRNHLRGES